MLTENEQKELDLIDSELDELLKMGSNDENLVSKRKRLLNKKFVKK